jgi:hypothetical protein
LQLLGSVASKNEMAVVDRVERAAEDTEFFQTILFVAMALWPCLFPALDMKFTVTV